MIRLKNVCIADDDQESFPLSERALDQFLLLWLLKQGYEIERDFKISWENNDDRLWYTIFFESDAQMETMVALRFGAFLA